MLKKADFCISTGNFQKAKEYLDALLEMDVEVAEAWWLKAKLPILQEDIIFYRGCSISVSTVINCDAGSRLEYLRQCGISPSHTAEAENLLNIDLLIEKEHIKYLEKAVACSKDDNEKYMKELTELKGKHAVRGINEMKLAKLIGFITLPLIVILLANLVFALVKMPLSYTIVSLCLGIIPYVLSIIGLTYYTKAVHERQKSAVGLIFNIANIILCNIALIVGVILIIQKISELLTCPMKIKRLPI